MKFSGVLFAVFVGSVAGAANEHEQGKLNDERPNAVRDGGVLRRHPRAVKRIFLQTFGGLSQFWRFWYYGLQNFEKNYLSVRPCWDQFWQNLKNGIDAKLKFMIIHREKF